MSRLDDGHSTKVTFADFPSVEFWEKEVTPPGVEGGGAVDTTTMHNTTWRTRNAKKLKTLTSGSFTAAYDPDVLTTINLMINVNQLITVTLPDGKAWQFWGWVDVFAPQALVEGEQPEAEVTIEPSNQNASGVETAPVVV